MVIQVRKVAVVCDMRKPSAFGVSQREGGLVGVVSWTVCVIMSHHFTLAFQWFAFLLPYF